MKIEIEIKEFKNISKKELDFMNKQRKKEWGKDSSLINKKDDEYC